MTINIAFGVLGSIFLGMIIEKIVRYYRDIKAMDAYRAPKPMLDVLDALYSVPYAERVDTLWVASRETIERLKQLSLWLTDDLFREKPTLSINDELAPNTLLLTQAGGKVLKELTLDLG